MADKIKLEIITVSLFLLKNHWDQAQENQEIDAYTKLRNSCNALYAACSFGNKRDAKKRNEKRQGSNVEKDEVEKSCKTAAAKNRAQHCSPKGRAYMKANRKTAYNRCYPVIAKPSNFPGLTVATPGKLCTQ